MTDNTWELWGFITCGLVLFAWAADAFRHWLLRRHRRQMFTFTRGAWDSRQDRVHRMAAQNRRERER